MSFSALARYGSSHPATRTCPAVRDKFSLRAGAGRFWAEGYAVKRTSTIRKLRTRGIRELYSPVMTRRELLHSLAVAPLARLRPGGEAGSFQSTTNPDVA